MLQDENGFKQHTCGTNMRCQEPVRESVQVQTAVLASCCQIILLPYCIYASTLHSCSICECIHVQIHLQSRDALASELGQALYACHMVLRWQLHAVKMASEVSINYSSFLSAMPSCLTAFAYY